MGRIRNKPNYPPEFKARAIELCLKAIIAGWSVARFSRHAHLSRVTVLEWLSDDTVFDRYARAMSIKALDFPSQHADIVKMVISGKIEPKVGQVALRAIEFRMMREIKRIYEPTRTVNHNLGNLAGQPDQEIIERYEQLKEKALAEAKAEGKMIEGVVRKV